MQYFVLKPTINRLIPSWPIVTLINMCLTTDGGPHHIRSKNFDAMFTRAAYRRDSLIISDLLLATLPVLSLADQTTSIITKSQHSIIRLSQ